MIELTSIYCPECGDAAEDMAPENEQDVRKAPVYRHVGDRTALCPVLTRACYQPAEPVEGHNEAAH